MLFLAVTVLVLGLERASTAASWLALTFLAVFTFLGVFALPALCVHAHRSRGRRAGWLLAAFALTFAASNLLWFPHSLTAFAPRNERLALNPPVHASPTLLLAKLGLYAPVEPKLLTALGLAIVLIAYAAQRLAIAEAVAASLFAGYVFLPDDSFDRLLLISLPFLLLAQPSRRQWVMLWLLTSASAAAAYVAERGLPGAFDPLDGALGHVFTSEGTLQFAAWINLSVACVLWVYLSGRRSAASAAQPRRRSIRWRAARHR